MNKNESVHKGPENQPIQKGDPPSKFQELISPATFGHNPQNLVSPATFGHNPQKLIEPATFCDVPPQHTPTQPRAPQPIPTPPALPQPVLPKDQPWPTVSMQSDGNQQTLPQGMADKIRAMMAPAGGVYNPQTTSAPIQGVPSTYIPAKSESVTVQQGDVIGKRTPRIKPYDVVQNLIRDGRIIVNNNAVYYFNGPVYSLLMKEDIKRLIVDRCRSAIEMDGSAALIDNVYKILLSEPRICRNDLTQSQDEVVFQDGVLNLRTNEFAEISPRCFATSYLNASFQKGQKMPCPTFDRFVAGIAGGDLELECRLWEVLGYCLTQDQRGQCFVVLQGSPNSGKSLFGNFLRQCFNKEAVSSLDLQSFGNEFALAALIGKRLCIDLDLPAGSINPRAASMLKKMPGEDMLSTNIKYMPMASFMNTAKLFFATNHMIFTKIRDDAILRRLVAVPFCFSVPEEARDPSLGRRLAAERDGVVVKALQYYRALRDRGYKFSGHFPVNMAVADYDDSGDCLIKFLREECEEAPHGWVSTQELYAWFCQRFGARWAMNVFSGRINEILPFIFPGAGKIRNRISGSVNPIGGFHGLALKSTENMTGT